MFTKRVGGVQKMGELGELKERRAGGDGRSCSLDDVVSFYYAAIALTTCWHEVGS